MGSTRRSPRTRARVLEHFRDSGRIDIACAAAGVNRSSHYEWLKADPVYRVGFEEAERQAADRLEAEAWRRALEGVAEPVFHAGKRVVEPVLDEQGRPVVYPDGRPVERAAVVRRYSDNVLMFLLKGRKRAVYGDKVEATGKDGTALFSVDAVRAYMQSVPDDEDDED